MSNPEVDRFGTTRYFNKNKNRYHREDGPAIIYPDGSEEWLVKGAFHRTDGPAVIYIDDSICNWYIKGTIFYNNKSFQGAANLNDEGMIAMILKYGDVG
jgi:hypothetical protein